MYIWYLTAMLGWLYALIGLNIQHDANHGAVSRIPFVNRVLGMSQNWIGGSAVDWIHQHVVQHHIQTNHVDRDPDIVGNDLLRFNPKNAFAYIHGFQHVYIFLLLPFFGFTYIIDSFKHNLERFHFSQYSPMLERHRNQELASILFFLSRWVVLPIYMTKTSFTSTFLNISPLFIVGGYYLSFFFIISHNFEGVVHHFHNSRETPNFLRRQVSSSSNVGGPVLCFINGGLNYQIEHHLFPRVSHVHYPTIAPVVREFCVSRGIPYVHFPTVWDNVSSCSRHLYAMGTDEAKKMKSSR
jgi:fatty acid desaturase (delta-4 desaturase)